MYTKGEIIKLLNVPRKAVESSNLIAIGFTDNTLIVEFKGGSVYTYSPITEDCYRQLMSAESKGKYFHETIKSNSNVNTECLKAKKK